MNQIISIIFITTLAVARAEGSQGEALSDHLLPKHSSEDLLNNQEPIFNHEHLEARKPEPHSTIPSGLVDLHDESLETFHPRHYWHQSRSSDESTNYEELNNDHSSQSDEFSEETSDENSDESSRGLSEFYGNLSDEESHDHHFDREADSRQASSNEDYWFDRLMHLPVVYLNHHHDHKHHLDTAQDVRKAVHQHFHVGLPQKDIRELLEHTHIFDNAESSEDDDQYDDAIEEDEEESSSSSSSSSEEHDGADHHQHIQHVGHQHRVPNAFEFLQFRNRHNLHDNIDQTSDEERHSVEDGSDSSSEESDEESDEESGEESDEESGEESDEESGEESDEDSGQHHHFHHHHHHRPSLTKHHHHHPQQNGPNGPHYHHRTKYHRPYESHEDDSEEFHKSEDSDNGSSEERGSHVGEARLVYLPLPRTSHHHHHSSKLSDTSSPHKEHSSITHGGGNSYHSGRRSHHHSKETLKLGIRTDGRVTSQPDVRHHRQHYGYRIRGFRTPH